MLSERNMRVLNAVVQAYISSHEPVGSRLLSRNYGFNLSSATIRNIMADLEEMGYLNQPHTSAGRVPTDRGFRFYVDTLDLSENRMEAMDLMNGIRGHLRSFRDDMNRLLSELTSMLSDVTHCLVFALPMRTSNTTLNRVQFYRYMGSKTVAVLLTNEGLVTSRVLDADYGLTQRELDRVGDYLNSEYAGHTIDEIRSLVAGQMARERDICDVLITSAIRICNEALSYSDTDVILSGLPGLVSSPEFSDNISRIMQAISDKHKIVRLLDRLGHAAAGVSVLIGQENPDLEMREFSVITANYGHLGRPLGSVGIIGPRSMDYSMAIPVVDVVAEFISSTI